MSKEEGTVPDDSPSSSMRKTWRKTSTKSKKKDDIPKGSMSELKGHYFLITEDDPTTIQDHCRTTLDAIGRHMCQKVNEAQELTKFFDRGRLPVIPMPEELPKNATKTEEALWNLKIKTYAKEQ